MDPLQSPLTFLPRLKETVWGGDCISRLKGEEPDGRLIGESWEICGLRGQESVVANGPFAGRNLRYLMQNHGDALVGKRVHALFGDEFPLLVKILDAHRDLSLQVHPHGKTEMWHILRAAPGAKIYSGFNRTVSADEFACAAGTAAIMDMVATHESRPGHNFLVPAGRIHAIGGGNLLIEVQEAADTTYRIYDHGRPRPLHIREACSVIHYNDPSDRNTLFNPDLPQSLAPCNAFTVKLFRGGGEIDHPADTFLIAMALQQPVTLGWEHGTTELTPGALLLFPACIASGVRILSGASLLTAWC